MPASRAASQLTSMPLTNTRRFTGAAERARDQGVRIEGQGRGWRQTKTSFSNSRSGTYFQSSRAVSRAEQARERARKAPRSTTRQVRRARDARRRNTECRSAAPPSPWPSRSPAARARGERAVAAHHDATICENVHAIRSHVIQQALVVRDEQRSERSARALASSIPVGDHLGRSRCRGRSRSHRGWRASASLARAAAGSSAALLLAAGEALVDAARSRNAVVHARRASSSRAPAARKSKASTSGEPRAWRERIERPP